ncbi:hypothetical protein UT300007_12420 [Clostridium sp. CTA-7]|jgi:hypothetical protein
MLDFDLMNVFNGFIKNYINFNLKKDSIKFYIVKQETRYFIMLGQLLGYSVIYKGLNENDKIASNKIELSWKDNDFNKMASGVTKLQLFRENDLENDLSAIQNLLNKVKENPNCVYIQIIETSSKTRIDYLNNIIATSTTGIKKDILAIYIIRDILNDTSYYNAYLFEKGKITKDKVGICYSDAVGNMKGIFKV